MIEVNLTKMSSKGQIVIPLSMRKDFKEGDSILLIKDDKRIILKKAEKITEQMKEDLEFAKRTEEAYKKHEKGNFIRENFDDFIENMKKW